MESGGLSRATRNRLAAVRLRENAYKERTLKLLREGADTRDPRFVGAFMAGKAAHQELEARLRSCARLELLRQQALRVKIRVEEQEARREFLSAHRRYLDSSLLDRIDAVDDSLAEQEDRLEEAASGAWGGPGGDLGAEEWMSRDDEDLLTRWRVEAAPAPGVLCDPSSPTRDLRRAEADIHPTAAHLAPPSP
ncbi:tegument protein UL14 [Saimiriine alphaherpesvirus 1]|uniref:Tegument protein UL14 n=1 Tax=Saimiriine herpesvirus 1 (strain MV-5-4-PSL) TaxID=10353 RepID=E2IUF6_SHV1|nr:tegument protein UL14 [Saimiriine alphaherpesvirus 1]ADO13814.1 tegument protein UL14 [Saimiriine alphaherpesvirus 1]